MVRSLVAIICFSALSATAQNNYARQLRQGNKAYADSSYTDAEASYRISAEERPGSAIPQFNLGDALYRQERFEEALEAYESGYDKLNTDAERADVLHNMGNAHFKMENYEDAAKAYQEALKLQPDDDETRYNLAQSIRRMRMPPPQQQQQQQEGDQEENEDENGQSSPQQDQQEQDQQHNENEEEQEEQGDPSEENPSGEKPINDQGEQEKLNREEAERLLEALQKQEEELREKLQKAERPKKKVKTEKDW